MVIANTARGLTYSFDLTCPEDFNALQALLDANQITALTLVREGTRYALPTPQRFRRLIFGAELIATKAEGVIGERIFVQADNVRVSLSVLFHSDLIRADLVNTGTLRYNSRGVKT